MRGTETSPWTIDELGEAIRRALSVDYAGAPTARVRSMPDRRTIRYYTTLGMLDRPLAMRGRTALYGRRHLMQVVAIKRLQAEGRSLAEIQRRLSGLPDEELAEIARLPEGLPPPPRVPARAPRRARFWAEPPAEEMRGFESGDWLGRSAAHDAVPASGERRGEGPPAPESWTMIPLGHGIRLLLDQDVVLDEEQRRKLAEAAEPIRAFLRRLGQG